MNLFLETMPTARAGEVSSKTYVVRATEEDNAKALRVMAIELGAGLLDGLTVTVEDLIKDHEAAAKHGL